MEAFKVMAMMTLQDLITAPLQNIGKKLDEAGIKANSLTGKIAKLGKSMAAISAAGAVMLGALGAVTASAAEFEQGLAKVSTLYGDVSVNTNKLSNDILALSSSSGIAATELNEALYESLSSGIPASEDMAEAVQFIEKSTKLARAGFADMATVVDATTGVLNAYRMDVSETDKIHKILMQTQNYGKTTVAQLGQSLAGVTPIAASMGVSFEQVGASLSTLTSASIPTAEAVTQLKSLFAELGKSGTIGQQALMKAADGTKYAGMTFQDMMKKGVPLSELLNLMANHAEKSGKKLLDLFGSIEAGNAALSLSGANTASYNKALTAMGETSDVVSSAYNKVTDTMSASLAKLKESFNALFITVGLMFTPVIKVAGNVMSKVVQIITAISKTKIGGTILKIIAAFSALVTVIGVLIGMFLLLQLAIAPIMAGLAVFAAPLILITVAVTALYLAFKNNFGGIADIVSSAWKKVTLVVKGVIAVFQSLKNGTGEIKGALAEDIKANGLVKAVTVISRVVYRVMMVFKGFTDMIKIYLANALIKIQPYITAVSRVLSFLGSVVSKVYSFIFGDVVSESSVDIWRKLGEIIATVVVAPFNLLASILNAIGNAANWVLDKLSSIANFFMNIDLAESGKKLVETFTNGIASVINKPKEMLQQGLANLRRLLPFSDAKEGPLSTLTLSGQRMMTTLAEGVEMASPDLKKTTSKALDNSLNIGSGISNIQVEPVKTIADNSTTNNTNKEQVIHIKIENISLDKVHDGSSFIKELQNLALSFGVV